MKAKICKATGKVSLSEAQCARKVHTYEQIRSWYYCDECGDYHITSMGSNQKFKQLKRMLSEDGMDLSNRELRKIMYSYCDWEFPVSKKVGICIGNYEDFKDHVNKQG